MTDKETLKRIENNAEQIVEREIGIKSGRSLLTPMDYGECLRCITAGAKSERNKVLDDAISDIESYCLKWKRRLPSDLEADLIKILQSLKL